MPEPEGINFTVENFNLIKLKPVPMFLFSLIMVNVFRKPRPDIIRKTVIEDKAHQFPEISGILYFVNSIIL